MRRYGLKQSHELEGKAVSKLQNAFSSGTCSSIVTARGCAEAGTAREYEKEQLEKRIEEEAGEMKKRKCTPIEYLLLFGQVPELEQVRRVMTIDNLTADDAQRLLDAGCSKRHLFRLYGVLNPGGPHYRQLEDLLGGGQPAEMIKQEKVNTTEGIAWIEPACSSQIRISKYGVMTISGAAVDSAPIKNQEGCQAKIGVDGAQGALIIMPEKSGTFILKRRGKTLSLASIAVTKALQAAGISIPSKFDASWDDKMQAWIGKVI